MKQIKVGNLELSDGHPKVCVPIVGENHDEVIEQAKEVVEMNPDIIEWRCDFFDSVYIDEVENMLIDLREVIKDIPLIFTFRTDGEGGEKFISNNSYYDLNVQVAKTGLAELIDVEAYSKDSIALDMIEEIHTAGAKVIGSNHHFNETPSREKIVETLMTMEELGADICKMAVMPSCEEDVKELVYGSIEANEKMIAPIVTMSMGELGAVTRVCGKTTGSVITFAAGVNASAPGQMTIEQVRNILDINCDDIKDKNIFMIGFMGTGKTTISNALGYIAGMPVVDIDKYIEKQENMSISDIFEKNGEEYFRKLETKALEDMQINAGKIVSCGGGVVLKDENIEIMKEGGRTVLITAEPKTIYDRICENKDRPLLNNHMTVEYIEKMIADREKRYQKAAQISIATDGKSRVEICGEILERTSF